MFYLLLTGSQVNLQREIKQDRVFMDNCVVITDNLVHYTPLFYICLKFPKIESSKSQNGYIQETQASHLLGQYSFPELLGMCAGRGRDP